MARNNQFQIISGPSRHMLVDSLLYAFDEQKIIVTFLLGNGQSIPVKIKSLAHESGSGENWNFMASAQGGPHDNTEIKGYFNSKSRAGWLIFQE